MNNSTPIKSADIQFVDLAQQKKHIGPDLDKAIADVLAHQQFIMGPEVAALERELEDFCGAAHAITCSSGTDALSLALLALDVKRGDAVVCPSFTFCATAEVIALIGAIPLFVDVDAHTFNINPADTDETITRAEAAGLNVAGVIAVDLFGRPADYEALELATSRRGKWLICDAAQSFGANSNGRAVGTIGTITATSFFPAKPLGCYGDGGAVFTNDEALSGIIKSLRVHGKGEHKYDNIRVGMAARLDTLQAAVLREKLKIFPDEIQKRRIIARQYNEYLSSTPAIETPNLHPGSVWAQYTLTVPAETRDSFQAHLKAKGIPSQVYYPKPLHKQKAYRTYEIHSKSLKKSENMSSRVISLPIHPYLDDRSLEYICYTIHNYYEKQR